MSVWSSAYSVRKLLFCEISDVSDVNRMNAGRLAFQVVGIDGKRIREAPSKNVRANCVASFTKSRNSGVASWSKLSVRCCNNWSVYDSIKRTPNMTITENRWNLRSSNARGKWKENGMEWKRSSRPKNRQMRSNTGKEQETLSTGSKSRV